MQSIRIKKKNYKKQKQKQNSFKKEKKVKKHNMVNKFKQFMNKLNSYKINYSR